MAILEAIGIGIAKHFFKEVIDSDALDQVSEEFVDLLKPSERGKHTLPAGSAALIMQSVILRVDEVLRESRLEEGTKEAVTLEFAGALARVNWSESTAIELRLNARSVAEMLTSQKELRLNLLGVDGRALFNQLVATAAETLVKASARFDGFTGLLGKSLLDDTGKLLEYLEKQRSAEVAAADTFHRAYVAAVERQLSVLDKSGYSRLDRVSEQQVLSTAYISLSVEPDIEGIIRALESEIRSKEINAWGRIIQLTQLIHEVDVGNSRKLQARYAQELQNFLMHEKVELSPSVRSKLTSLRNDLARSPRSTLGRLSIEETLQGSRRLVVKGRAGSGKSTLLQWLAINSANSGFKDPLATWNDTVPFFVRLRNYIGRDFPRAEEFATAFTPDLADRKPRTWVADILEAGNGLVLIDGVDEFPKVQRPAMLSRLKELVAMFPLSRYVISSRPATIKEEVWPEWTDWLTAAEFKTATLRDMDREHVRGFITQWHLAYDTVLAEGSRSMERARLRAEQLWKVIFARPALTRLAVNPLLCALICALYQIRGQALPESRLELYRECIEMLLGDRRRETTRTGYPDLNPSQLKTIIQSVAYWMSDNEFISVDTSYIDRVIADKLPSIGKSETEASSVRAYLTDRTDLLREPVIGKVDFTHLTFQEYLAACEIARQGSTGLLLRQLPNDKWREIIVVSIGEMRPNEVEAIISRIVDNAETAKTDGDRKYAASLAFACLETAAEVSPALRARIAALTPLVMPPESIVDARMIALAGEHIIPYLQWSELSTARYLDWAIRILAMIGSERALEALEEYASKIDRAYSSALLSAWDSFDREIYGNRIIARLKALRIERWSQDYDFVYLRNLESIEILDSPHFLGGPRFGWSNLPKLTKVTFNGTRSGDIFSLPALPPQITRCAIFLNQRRITYKNFDLSELVKNATGLEEFILEGDVNITSLWPLHDKLQLNLVQIPLHKDGPADFDVLNDLPNLARLRITSEGKPFDLSDIKRNDLEELMINGVVAPESRREIARFMNLNNLRITLDADDMYVLGELKKLQSLELELQRGTSIRFGDVMQSLEYLSVSSDGKPLRLSTDDIPNLKTIALFDAEVDTELLQQIADLPHSPVIYLGLHQHDIAFEAGLTSIEDIGDISRFQRVP